MATIEFDLPGSVYTSEVGGTAGQANYLRKARVDGLLQTTAIALIKETIDALPPLWSKLDDPFNLYLERRVVQQIGFTRLETGDVNRWALVDLAYRFRSSSYIGGGGGIPNDNGLTTRISSGGSIYQTEVNFDRFGNQLKTTYDNATQAHRATAFGIQSSPSFTRLEQSDPQDRADQYVGRVNSTTWNGKAPRTVLCASILGESEDSGESFQVDYTFHFRPEGWEYEAIHDDPLFPGNPIPDPINGDPLAPAGRVIYEILGEDNFNNLNLV